MTNIQSLIDSIADIEVNTGDAILSGYYDELRIGHILKIDIQGFHIYFSDCEEIKIWDGMSVKIARRRYIRSYDESEDAQDW